MCRCGLVIIDALGSCLCLCCCYLCAFRFTHTCFLGHSAACARYGRDRARAMQAVISRMSFLVWRRLLVGYTSVDSRSSIPLASPSPLSPLPHSSTLPRCPHAIPPSPPGPMLHSLHGGLYAYAETKSTEGHTHRHMLLRCPRLCTAAFQHGSKAPCCAAPFP